MQLSEHFSLQALIASETAVRMGIDNRPPPELMANLRALAAGLEEVRAALGDRTIHVSSGFRCIALNSAVGGAKESRHMRGLAADILCPQFGPPLAVCRAILAANIEADQIIHEFGKWCHVSFAAPGDAPRRQLLTIASAALGYSEGLNPVT